MDSSSLSLQTLHDDVLLQIFDILRPNQGLRSLSTTCKSLRRACAPSLFKNCIINVATPITPERLLPARLQAHCQSLTLMDDCPDLGSLTKTHRRLRYTDDRLLCGVIDGQVLKGVLLAMPRLRSISISFICKEIHGLRWETLVSILSVPRLETFTLQRFNFSPRLRLASNLDALTVAPLKSFRYVQAAFLWPRIPHYFPPERDALADVLGRLHDTLEILHLPSMSAPIDALSVRLWPCLRKLVLQGQLPEDIRSPFITLLSGMPKLRILRLMFALPHGIPPTPIWPRGVDTSFPWPDLEELVLSFPTPDDQLYSCLPPSLRRLSLRCCPHRCVHEWVDRPEWHSPILSASEMLNVLSRCQLPHLDHLQFEYRADDADASLLQYLHAAFPRLLTLELHRFRPAGVHDIPLVAIGQEIGSLSRLDMLSLHLDSVDHPEPTFESLRMGGFVPVMSFEQMTASDRMLHSQADVLAPLLSKSVRLLRLVQRNGDDASWEAYRILRAPDTGNVLRTCYDAERSTEHLSPNWFVDFTDPD